LTEFSQVLMNHLILCYASIPSHSCTFKRQLTPSDWYSQCNNTRRWSHKWLSDWETV